MQPSFSVDRPTKPMTEPIRPSRPSGESVHQQPEPKSSSLDRPASPHPDRITSSRRELHVTNPSITLKPQEIELIKAVRDGKAGHVRALLSKDDVNPNIRDSDGRTLLHESILQKHYQFQVFKALVDNGVNIHVPDNSGDTALLLAAKKRRLNETHLLLENRADPNTSDASGSTPLMISSEKGHDEIVQEILSQGTDLNLDANLKRQHDGTSAIMLAATNGHQKVFRSLDRYGADLNAKNNNGSNLLMLSSQNGHVDIVRDLLSKNIDPNQQNNMGRTALIFAAQNGHPKTAQKLLEHGADPNIEGKDARGVGKWTALMAASYSKQGYPVVKKLLEYNADPNAQDELGGTALMRASKEGLIETAEALLDNTSGVGRQANSNMQSTFGITALMLAVRGNHPQMVKVLLDHNANPNLRAMGGYTAPMAATSDDDSDIAIFKALSAKGANFNLQSEDGHNAFMYLCHHGKLNIVEMLLQKGMNPNVQGAKGFTPLMASAVFGKSNVSKLLLLNGALPNLQDQNGNTALMIASQNGHTDSVKGLLAHNPDLNLANEDGMTALAFAVLSDHPNVVKELLQHGAEPNVINRNGLTPLTMASVNGKTETTKILLQHYAKYHATKEDPIVSDDSQNEHESNALKVQCFDALRLASQHIESYNDRLDALTQAALIMGKLRSEDSYIVGQAINVLSEDSSKAATAEDKAQMEQRQMQV